MSMPYAKFKDEERSNSVETMENGGTNGDGGGKPSTPTIVCEQVTVNLGLGNGIKTSDEMDNEASSRIKEDVEPDRREMIRRFVEHFAFRLFSLLLIIIDSLLLIIDVATGPRIRSEQNVFDGLALFFISYFVVEVGLRIYANGVTNFYNNWYNSVDFVVIMVSFIVTVTYSLVDITGAIKLVTLGRFIRAFTLVRFLRAFITEPQNIKKGARTVVSQNKRRYRDGKFDLDLTYINERVIGMSFPSSGKMALYRNNIKDVAKFFDVTYGVGRVKVYNLCSERSYDPVHFHGHVARYPIDDHNVPTLEQMMSFVFDIKEWLAADPKNTIAIHCRGGKGRTGSMICAWLIFNGDFDGSKDVLEFFADRRTDRSFSTKYQGVETPSQNRYVEYFSQLIKELDYKIPEKVRFRLNSIRITALAGIGTGDGSDLACSVMIDRKTNFIMIFGSGNNCETDYHPEQDVLTIRPRNCPPLVGDIRMKFECKSKGVPKAYEDCAFFFWFNTAFLKKTDGDEYYRLLIPRNELDNPHKSKTWKVYRERFSVEIIMENVMEL